MLNFSSRLALIILILTGLFLRSADYTSADLTADRVVRSNQIAAAVISLDLSDSASNQTINRLFDIPGLVPGGFAVASLKLVNSSCHNYPYRLAIQSVTGNPDFCRQLDLELMIGRKSVYHHSLDGFSYDSALESGQSRDLIFIISLPQTDSISTHHSCQFDLIAASLKNGSIPQKGLFARRQILNFISSGPIN